MPTKSEFAPAPLAKEPYSARLLDNIWQNHVKNPNKPAFISADDDSIRVTNLQLYLSSQSVAAFLNNIHFGHGDVSSIVLPNCWEYFAIFVGVSVQGGAISGASTVFTEMELARQFQDSKTKVVFCADTVLDKVIKASRGLGIISIVVVPSDPRSPKKELPFGVHDIQDVFAAQPQTNQPKIKHDIDTDLLILPYSSGTTGPPKGVMLSHANVGTVLNIWIQHFEKNIKPRLDPNWNWETENTLLVLPFYHMYGFTLAHQCILTGSTGIIMKRFELDKYLRAIEKFKIRVLNVAPPILVFLAKSPLVEKYNLSCLEFIVTRSAPARQEIIEEVLKRLPKIKFITQAYGMTEIGLIGAHYPVDKPEQYNAVGKLASNLELKIVDPSTRKELNTGEIGEICVRGPSVMNGYLGNPTATAGTFEDGWLKTGDVGYVDKDGWLYIVERLKELIKVKGFQVAPAELEDLLLSHPDIQDSAVIGVPDPVAGELPKAFVVRKRETLTEEDVKNFVKAKAAPYKQLQGGVEFMKEIPKSASGKILRRILRDQVAKEAKKPVLSKL